MADIIRSYGLFWKANDVHWNSAKKSGELLGVPAKARRRPPTNFRDQVGVYVLYSGHRMVYVGQAGASNAPLFGRLKTHYSRDHLAGRWDTFSWFGLKWVRNNGVLASGSQRAAAPIATALNQMEAILIASTEPDFNKQGGRFGRRATRYIQVRDGRLGPTTEQMLRDLWDSLQTE